jgi:hypothetical protein
MTLPRLIKALLVVFAATLVAPQARAAVVVDFDDFDAGGGFVSGASVASYLLGYGITFSSTTLGVVPGILFAPAGDPVASLSQPNLFATGGGPLTGYSFRFDLSGLMDSVSFSTPAIGSGSTMAIWSASAFSATDVLLASAGNPGISFPGTPSALHTLNGPGISYVDFFSNVNSFAGHNLKFDDFSMTAAIPEPQTYALLLAGLGLLGFAARRKR